MPGSFQVGPNRGAVVTRAQVVVQARSWLGTPFLHQAALRGVGADCGGLIRGVLLNLNLVPFDYEKQLGPDALAYKRRPDGVTLKAYCDTYFSPIAVNEALPGDMCLVRFGALPQHLAFFGNYIHGGLSMIHALGPVDPCKVTENRFDDVWRSRLVGAYRIPGVI